MDDLRKYLDVASGGKDSGIMTFTLPSEDPQNAEAMLKNITDNYLQQNVDRKTEETQRMLAFLQEQLPQTQTSLNNAETQLNQFRQQNDSVDLSLEAKSVLDTQVQLEAQLNELTFKEAEISKLYTRAHPAYRALLESAPRWRRKRRGWVNRCRRCRKCSRRSCASPATCRWISRFTCS